MAPNLRKRPRMENVPVKSCQFADNRSVTPDVLQIIRKTGSNNPTGVSDLVSEHRHKTFDLKSPAGARWMIGNLDDTMYSEDDGDVNGWGKFYLPEIVRMQVLGVVEGTSCPCDQLVLMTCEDRKVYAYDGEELHLVASSLKQLVDEGIEYPASTRYFDGEAFKDLTKKDWAEVNKRVDQKHHELVESMMPTFLENLRKIKHNKELHGESQRTTTHNMQKPSRQKHSCGVARVPTAATLCC